jgi:hypothetical protein
MPLGTDFADFGTCMGLLKAGIEIEIATGSGFRVRPVLPLGRVGMGRPVSACAFACVRKPPHGGERANWCRHRPRVTPGALAIR